MIILDHCWQNHGSSKKAKDHIMKIVLPVEDVEDLVGNGFCCFCQRRGVVSRPSSDKKMLQENI